MESEFWSVTEAAKFAGCTEETVRKAIRTNRLAAYTAQGVRGYRVRPADVKAWLAPKLVSPDERPGSPTPDPSDGGGVSDPGALQDGPPKEES